MPELPEVETNKKILLSLVKDKIINNVDIFYNNLIKSNIDDFKKNIQNKRILNIERKGKFLLFFLSEDFILLVHLRMEGKFTYNDYRVSSTSLIFNFKDNSKLFFNDTRKFAFMYLDKKDKVLSLNMLKELGIEANKIEEIDYDNIIKKLSKNKPIKSLITDQKILAGIGNIYADEILYKSKINPLTKGKDLKYNDFINIFKNSNAILNEAIKLNGCSVHTFKVNQKKGSYQDKLLCYGKEGEPCPICQTKFHKIFLNKRGTTFCPNCQLYLPYKKAIGICGPIGSGKSTLLNFFSKLGFLTLSSDNIIKDLYKNTLINKKISKLFNKNIDIDRDKKFIKEKITSSFILKEKLQDILFYELEKVLLNYIINNDNIVIEVPLLFNAHFEYLFKKIYVLKINKENQIRNLKVRGDDVLSSLKLNESYYFNNDNKDIKIIENDGSINDLYHKIELDLKAN